MYIILDLLCFVAYRVVESVGEGVTDLKAGDHVLPVFTGECKECRHCKSSESNMCDLLRINTDRGVMIEDGKTRFFKDGKPIHHFLGTSTFSEYTVVHLGCLAKINPEAPLDKVCVLSCGISTGNWDSNIYFFYYISVPLFIEFVLFGDSRTWCHSKCCQTHKGFNRSYFRIGSRWPCSESIIIFLLISRN